MMRNARIYVADVMDQVVIQATVWELDRNKEPLVEEISYEAQCNSVGEEVPHEWLKEALIALIETL